nr:protein FAM154B [Hymenolepis microstoma]
MRRKTNVFVLYKSRHQCPHQKKRVVPWGPCVISEYNDKFRAHSACPLRPVKPATVVLRSDEPMSDKTTHREDYVPKAFERRQGRPKETYKPPSTAFDHDTNYRLTYTPKEVCPPEPCLPPPILGCPAKFDGNATYRSDYRPWSVPPRERRKMDTYKPPDAPFDGLSTSRADYVPKGNCKRSSLKPVMKLFQTDQPLDGETNYRTDYIPHPLEPRERSKKEYQIKTAAPFDGITTHRADYTPKDVCIPRSRKPTDVLIRSEEPMSGDTTNRVDYIPHQLQPQRKHRPSGEYKVPDMPMEKGTTYKLDYPATRAGGHH